MGVQRGAQSQRQRERERDKDDGEQLARRCCPRTALQT